MVIVKVWGGNKEDLLFNEYKVSYLYISYTRINSKDLQCNIVPKVSHTVLRTLEI